MKVIGIDSNKSFKFHGPRAEQGKPEGPKHEEPKARFTRFSEPLIMLAGLGLTAWLPAFIWCLVINHALPLYLIGVTEIVGSAIGALLYRLSAPARTSCVPVTNIPAAKSVHRFDKAA